MEGTGSGRCKLYISSDIYYGYNCLVIFTIQGQLPQVRPFVYGIKPAVVVIVLLAAWKLGAKAIKSRILFVFGVIALSFSLLGGNEIVALFGVGLLCFDMVFNCSDKEYIW